MDKAMDKRLREVKARRHGISSPQKRNEDIDFLLGCVKILDHSLTLRKQEARKTKTKPKSKKSE